MTEAERLRAYFAFDDDVLARVAEAAEVQRSKTWQTLAKELPAPKIFKPKHGKPIEVVEFGPKDSDDVQIYHLAMACGLDPNIMLCVAMLAAVGRGTRIIAVGNPGAVGRGTGALRLRDMPGVWRGNLNATVRPTMEYAQANGVRRAVHIGYSFGADKAAAAIGLAAEYNQTVTKAIFMDPAAVMQRSLNNLARAFDEAGEVLEDYVMAADIPAYREARKVTHKMGHGAVGYIAGLFRPTNVMIAHALAKDGFETRVRMALKNQPELKVSIAWGSASELAHHGQMTKLTQRVSNDFAGRVQTLVVEHQRHAMGSDLFLHDAIVLQCLKQK